MISLSLSILSLIALSVAQNQTVSLFFPDTDSQSLVGSIVGGDATATTYVVECANGRSNAAAATTSAAATTGPAAAATGLGDDDGDDDVCGFPVPVTIVEGPSTVAYALTLDDSTVSLNCVLSGTSVAVCTEAATGPILTVETADATTTATLSGTDVFYMPVVITAGSVSNTASTPTSTVASTTGGAKGAQNGGSTSPTSSANSNGGTKTQSGSTTQTQTGSTTAASTQASGAAMHMGPAMGMGAAGALAAVAAVVL